LHEPQTAEKNDNSKLQRRDFNFRHEIQTIDYNALLYYSEEEAIEEFTIYLKNLKK
jgi:hypothetical protein